MVLLLYAISILAAESVYALPPGRNRASLSHWMKRPLPHSLRPPTPPPYSAPSKTFRREIEKIHFLPTPLPPLDSQTQAIEHTLAQPKKPVYHYTPIKPFTTEELRNIQAEKDIIVIPKEFVRTRYTNSGGRFAKDVARDLRNGDLYGPPVYESTTEDPPPQKEIRTSNVKPKELHPLASGLTLAPQLADIKNTQLGEAFFEETTDSRGFQMQNPAHIKYHYEYRVREPNGEFRHVEAKIGPVTTGGYDLNLHKAHIQSMRYLVDSKELPFHHDIH